MDEHSNELMRANLHKVFGQREAGARREAAELTYAQDVTFTDEGGTVSGVSAILEKARALLAGVPTDFSFAEASPVYAGDGRGALGWTFGAPGAEPVARGLDVATIVDGRISRLQTLLAT